VENGPSICANGREEFSKVTLDGCFGAGHWKPALVTNFARPPVGGAPSMALTAWHSAFTCTGNFRNDAISATTSGMLDEVTSQCIVMISQ
jgi:hypothetical protein